MLTTPAPILVLSCSARPYVQALVQAGYPAIALDAFVDQETQQLALHCERLAMQAETWDSAALMCQLDALQHRFKPMGLVYGSGVEGQPPILQAIATRLPLLGNTAEVVAAVRSADFFQQLRALDIPFPPTPPHPISGAQVLIKSWASSGGHSIRWASGDERLAAHEYFQQHMQGEVYGLLFAADGQDILAIGIHQQWPAGTPSRPMRAGHIISQATLAPAQQAQIISMAQSLTQHYQLRGLNSLDVIVHQGQALCLELNPRLSASMDLYQTTPRLMSLHMAGLAGELPSQIQQSSQSCGRSIVWAQYPWRAHAGEWPDWVSDRPMAGSLIQAGEPICTIQAVAENAQECALLLEQRQQFLSQWLLQNHHDKREQR